MTGLPSMSSSAEAGLLRARAMAERAQIVAAEPAVAAQIGRLAARPAHAVRRAQRARHRCECARARAGSSADTNGGMGPVGAMPASSVGVMQHARGSPRVAQVFERHERARAARSASSQRPARHASKSWEQSAGATQPEPVVKPGSWKSRRCTIGRPLAYAADDPGPVDTAEQPVEIRIGRRIVADHGVLDRHRNAVGHQASNSIEPGFPIGAEAVFGFQVERSAARRRRRPFPAGRPPFRRHRADRRMAASWRVRKLVRAQEPRLIDRAAKRRPEAGNRPARSRKRRRAIRGGCRTRPR